MKKYKPVSVSKAAFAFCRYILAILIWLSFIFKSEIILTIVFIIFILSAILKIKKAPMIVLYTHTINRVIKSKDVVLNEPSMRFAHIMGSILSLICLLLIFFVNEKIGWIAVLILALMKSLSFFGFCPGSKIYDCVTDNNSKCCSFLKKKHGR